MDLSELVRILFSLLLSSTCQVITKALTRTADKYSAGNKQALTTYL